MKRFLIIGLGASLALVQAFDLLRADNTHPDAGASQPPASPAAPNARSEPEKLPGPHLAQKSAQVNLDVRQVSGAAITPPAAEPRAQPLYTVPRDPAELAKRFYGEAAEAVATKWQGEPSSPEAAHVEDTIYATFSDAEAIQGVRDIECRRTLCRLQLDKKIVSDDHAVVTRMSGKLGVNGWMLHGSTPDELITFIPIDFKPM